jgi:peptidoglycan hydrolase-like protein with peptidoglycan-binding domain
MALSWPLVAEGATGEDVRTIQFFLNAHGRNLGVDGNFGPLTKAAVQAFQASKGLATDGIVGDKTWPALVIEVSTGSQGAAVKALQSQVASRGATPLAIDGVFGSDTLASVQQFQTWVGLSVDGIVGPITWNAYVDGYLPGPNTSQVAHVVFQAWTQNDELTVKKNTDSTTNAVTELFSQKWSPSAGWTFDGANGAAGTIYYTWKPSSGQQLVLGIADGAGGYFYLQVVSRQ